ncbi:MAG: hypothetical protein ACRD0U_14135, partial [Acidimicrobiales bacterium]
VPDPREPHVTSWYHVDFDVTAAQRAVDAIEDVLVALATNRSARGSLKPTLDDWEGPHFDRFAADWGLHESVQDQLEEELASQRTTIANAMAQAEGEMGRRQGQWDAWERWWQAHGRDQGVAHRRPQVRFERIYRTPGGRAVR